MKQLILYQTWLYLPCKSHAPNCAHCLSAVLQHRSGPILSAGPSLRQPLCRIVSNNIVFWRLMSLRVKPSEREHGFRAEVDPDPELCVNLSACLSGQVQTTVLRSLYSTLGCCIVFGLVAHS